MANVTDFHKDIQRFLSEDLNEFGDITSDSLFGDENANAHIIAKQSGVIAGLYEITQLFKKTGAQLESDLTDGDTIRKNQVIAEITGPVRSILKTERLALNILGRMSGIATETKQLTTLCNKINPNTRIAATRKTTPGFRYFEKKAVEIGGGEPHRFGLYDAVLIKDNHIKLYGSVKNALEKIQRTIKDKTIEIEVENEPDAITAAKMNVDVIMLDNIPPSKGKKIAEKIRAINPKILIEVSGGITKKNIEQFTFADRISLGYLTHSITSIDFSLEFT